MPQGAKPAYLQSVDLNFPNSGAVIQAAFVPDLELGFVPQGLADLGADLLLSGYIFGAKAACQIYMISKLSLTVVSSFTVPARCSHAGGITVTPDGRIMLVDYRRLFVWRPQTEMLEPERTIQSVKLGNGLTGAFASATTNGFILGTFSRQTNKTTARLFPWEALESGKTTLSSEDAMAERVVPTKTQGYAEATDGAIWTTSQGAPYNFITRLDQKEATRFTYPFVRGLQGIVADRDGSLWTVSESGALPYRHRADAFPAIIQISPARLAEDPSAGK